MTCRLDSCFWCSHFQSMTTCQFAVDVICKIVGVDFKSTTQDPVELTMDVCARLQQIRVMMDTFHEQTTKTSRFQTRSHAAIFLDKVYQAMKLKPTTNAGDHVVQLYSVICGLVKQYCVLKGSKE